MPFTSLELSAEIKSDSAALARAMARAHIVEQSRTESFKAISHGVAGGWHQYNWHIWWTPPSLWRDEVTHANGGTTVIIIRPDLALGYVPFFQTLYTSDPLGTQKVKRGPDSAEMQSATIDDRLMEFPLIRPRLPSADWQRDFVEDTAYLGRPARRFRATRRAGSIPAWDPRTSGFWMGVDEYDCVLDDQLEIVLSVVGIVDRSTVATISVNKIIVDAPIPAGTFDFSPPPGTRSAHWRRPTTKRVG